MSRYCFNKAGLELGGSGGVNGEISIKNLISAKQPYTKYDY